MTHTDMTKQFCTNPKLSDWFPTPQLIKTSIYARINEGTFPRQIPIGSNSVVWLEKDVIAWMEKQMEEA